MAYNDVGNVFLQSLVAPKHTSLMIAGQIVPSVIESFRARFDFKLELFGLQFETVADEVEILFQHLGDIRELFILVPTEYFHPTIWDRVAGGELLPQLGHLALHPRPAPHW
ncbi:hypothetical protein B0H19DRAFT_1059854 [Mycena capillaripes]|nr:hypothetical protein B0H19DRAFT_1059854 [Mycena capillaripes]